jgi:hypothetical protein
MVVDYDLGRLERSDGEISRTYIDISVERILRKDCNHRRVDWIERIDRTLALM